MSSGARGWKPTLRYSPRNMIIVDWGINNEPFSMCGMPQPDCPGPAPVPPSDPDCPCGETPIVEDVPTYAWSRWVPEIIAGFNEASEDMAATYARRAAIEFATKTRVLQRQIALPLQEGVLRYPLFPFTDESIQGVLSIDSPMGACQCECSQQGINIGRVYVDIPTQEIRMQPTPGACGCHMAASGPKQLLLTVWAAPTEDSCEHDAFLYTQYRREIALGARADFIAEAMAFGAYKTSRGYANFRGDALMFQRADRLKTEFQQTLRKARVEAATKNAVEPDEAIPLFAAGCCAPRRH